MFILFLPDLIGWDFSESSKGKALQEVGAKRAHQPLTHRAPSLKPLLEQVHEAGDAGLIETSKISGLTIDRLSPKSQECLRWLGKVKSWSVVGFLGGMLCLKSEKVREKGVIEKATSISIVGGNIDWIITYRHSYTQLIAK